MAQFAQQPDRDIRELPTREVVNREVTESSVRGIANPIPLGLGALAFTTAVLGCSYAGFIVPSLRSGLSIVVAAALFYGGIVQILAGMWAFRRDTTVAATVFSSYGGFLVAFGVLFLPSFGLTSTLSANGLHAALGLLFLCWTIFAGVLFLGSLKSGAAMTASTGALVLLLPVPDYRAISVCQYCPPRYRRLDWYRNRHRCLVRSIGRNAQCDQ